MNLRFATLAIVAGSSLGLTTASFAVMKTEFSGLGLIGQKIPNE